MRYTPCLLGSASQSVCGTPGVRSSRYGCRSPYRNVSMRASSLSICCTSVVYACSQALRKSCRADGLMAIGPLTLVALFVRRHGSGAMGLPDEARPVARVNRDHLAAVPETVVHGVETSRPASDGSPPGAGVPRCFPRGPEPPLAHGEKPPPGRRLGALRLSPSTFAFHPRSVPRMTSASTAGAPCGRARNRNPRTALSTAAWISGAPRAPPLGHPFTVLVLRAPEDA
jgi:hypothetical protein